jgi:glycosyltransferase involved in cell wall biosynthesis
VPDILNGIDIYCLPSLWEGLPIGLLEAMAMGKAVVATAIDGTKEIVENNKNGLLIDPGAPKDLAEAIIQLASDKKMRMEFGSKAMHKIQGDYSLKKMATQVENIYTQVLDKPLPKSKSFVV